MSTLLMHFVFGHLFDLYYTITLIILNMRF